MATLLLLTLIGVDWKMGTIEDRVASLEAKVAQLEAVRSSDCQCTLCRCGTNSQAVPMPSAPVTIQPAPAIRYSPIQASYETAAPVRRGFFGLFRGRSVKYCGPSGCN